MGKKFNIFKKPLNHCTGGLSGFRTKPGQTYIQLHEIDLEIRKRKSDYLTNKITEVPNKNSKIWIIINKQQNCQKDQKNLIYQNRTIPSPQQVDQHLIHCLFH